MSIPNGHHINNGTLLLPTKVVSGNSKGFRLAPRSSLKRNIVVPGDSHSSMNDNVSANKVDENTLDTAIHSTQCIRECHFHPVVAESNRDVQTVSVTPIGSPYTRHSTHPNAVRKDDQTIYLGIDDVNSSTLFLPDLQDPSVEQHDPDVFQFLY